jgi:hypothetical protein
MDASHPSYLDPAVLDTFLVVAEQMANQDSSPIGARSARSETA